MRRIFSKEKKMENLEKKKIMKKILKCISTVSFGLTLLFLILLVSSLDIDMREPIRQMYPNWIEYSVWIHFNWNLQTAGIVFMVLGVISKVIDILTD